MDKDIQRRLEGGNLLNEAGFETVTIGEEALSLGLGDVYIENAAFEISGIRRG